MSRQLNHLTAVFHGALAKAISADKKEDINTQLMAMTNVFTQVCIGWETEEEAKMRALNEVYETITTVCELKKKLRTADDAFEQLHVLLAAQNCNSSDSTSRMIFENMRSEVRANMFRLGNLRLLEASLETTMQRCQRMNDHINELSKQSIMHHMATRFYARELAAMRQLMDLIHNASTIKAAVKSKLWDDIEAENRLLRLNGLWLINQINAPLRNASYGIHNGLMSPPRIVILMRDHLQQGLGLEITGGSEEFPPVIVTAKLPGSMADDDELRMGDRILAIDGTFVTSTTTHEEVMQMLETESQKDFIALIVSEFDPNKCPDTVQPVSPSVASTQQSDSTD